MSIDDSPEAMMGRLEAAEARVAELEGMCKTLDLENKMHVIEKSWCLWKLIEGPGLDGHKVLLRELDPFDRFNRGEENRDAIAAGYWNDERKFWVWPFGSTDHPPTHWAPLPPRLNNPRDSR